MSSFGAMKKKLGRFFWMTFYFSGIPTIYRLFFAKKRLTVLGYHSIGNGDKEITAHTSLYAHLSVPVELFERHMQWLLRRGYSFLTFPDILAIREGKKQMPAYPVLVYFDDGYRDNYQNAYPVLQRFGIRATLFLVTDCIDQKRILWEAEHTPFAERIFLTWDEISNMSDSFDFGTHTVTHRKLPALSSEDVRYELQHSRALIEKHTGKKVLALSYPKSRFSDNVRRIATEEGFEFILAHGRGFHHSADMRYLEKIPIEPNDALVSFGLKLGIYYPIMHACRLWRSHL